VVEGWREAPGWFCSLSFQQDTFLRLHNLNHLKPRRRQLRSALTLAGARLWTALQSAKLKGRKFRRQHSVGPHVLDFYCSAEKLAVELDGAAHDHEAALLRDEARSKCLEELGIRVVRFENRSVIENLEGALSEIAGQFRGD
jgi:very-short-patch-repair endonuclease